MIIRKFRIFGSFNWYELFKRRTTTNFFIPEIDGLRFIAILFVIIEHICDLFHDRSLFQNNLALPEHSFRYLAQSGTGGVYLFFAISGFILSIPFAQHYLSNKKEIDLKKYYLRRITRLEPPFILAMAFLFLMKILIQNKSIDELLPHFWATITYTHGLIYHTMSEITPITWSLEVEAQFYLLAPVLTKIFRLSKLLRRLILTGIIFFVPFLQNSNEIFRLSLPGTIQYFAVGFLLADIYLCREKLKFNHELNKVLGVLFFLTFILIKPDSPIAQVFYAFAILSFCYIVLIMEDLKHIFRNKIFTSIGGMCYSIYLIHFAIISLFGMITFKLLVTNFYIINCFFQGVCLIPIILLISSAFFLTIEKPCMDSQWPIKLKMFFNKR